MRPKNGQKDLVNASPRIASAADQMAERQELLRGKIAIGKLVAEKHAHDGGDGKCVQNPGLLRSGELQAGQIAVDQRQPTAPDEKLQDHHDEKAKSDLSIHA